MFISLLLQIITGLNSTIWTVEGYDFAFLDKDTVLIVNKKSIDTYSISKRKCLTSRPHSEGSSKLLGISDDGKAIFFLRYGVIKKLDLAHEHRKPLSLDMPEYWGRHTFFSAKTNQIIDYQVSQVLIINCDNLKVESRVKLAIGLGSGSRVRDIFVDKDSIHLYFDPSSTVKTISRIVIDTKEMNVKSTLFEVGKETKVQNVLAHPKDPEIFWSVTERKLCVTTKDGRTEINKEANASTNLALDPKVEKLLVPEMNTVRVYRFDEKFKHCSELFWKLDSKLHLWKGSFSPDSTSFALAGTLQQEEKEIIIIGSLKK